MTKKILSIVLACVLMFGSTAFADGKNINSSDEPKVSSSELSIDFLLKVSDENILDNKINIEGVTFGNKKNNILTSSFNNRSVGVLNATTTNEEDNNTNPNAYKYMQVNTGLSGKIVNEGEFRWYATMLDKKSKIALFAAPQNNQDYDLYLYKLNTDTSTLEYVTGSAAGVGKTEKISMIADKGIYFFAVHGKSGTGDFGLALFASTYDLDYELNNTVPTATSLPQKRVVSVSGIIDNPGDVDVYKFEVTNEEFSKIELISPSGVNYKLSYSDGEALYNIGKFYKFKPGTHYLIVNAPSGDYSQNNPYTLKKTMYDSEGTVKLLAMSKDKKYIATYRSGSYYVNNTRINFNYLYKHNFSHPATGTHSTTKFEVKEHNDTKVVGNVGRFGYYHTTFPNDRNLNNALKLSIDNVSYFVWRSSGGIHSGPNMTDSYTSLTVIIDPNTGRVFDIYEPNFFYVAGYHESFFSPY